MVLYIENSHESRNHELVTCAWTLNVLTFFGEKTPTVSPSSLTATPISAKTASLCSLMASVRFNFSSHVSFSSVTTVINCQIRGSHTSVIMRSIFWDLTLCHLLKVNWHFGGTHCLHIQGSKEWAHWRAQFLDGLASKDPSVSISSHIPASQLLDFLPGLFWFLPWLTLQPWSWRWHVPLKRRWISMHYMQSMKTVFDFFL